MRRRGYRRFSEALRTAGPSSPTSPACPTSHPASDISGATRWLGSAAAVAGVEEAREPEAGQSARIVPASSATHDRDINAAVNVLNEARMVAAGQAETVNDRRAQVRPGPVPAPRSEAVTHPNGACSTRSVEGILAL